ncbi:MAG TPA: M24 family metallopeptidase [Verrucomicrobiae bacterium]|jgi:Xaa-Pro aminopeptidase|nr:M24 family metallopeptidase [Verrucomicrobiae bacterium]
MDKPIIPTFSLQERDRRWAVVRAEMKKANLDAVIGLPNQGHWDQFGADIRYLTQIGGFQTEVAAVFPLGDEPTAVVRGANEIEWWGLAQEWIKDLRPSRRSYGEPVTQRLKEIRAERVGVIGLSGLVRAPEGVVPWGTYEKIRSALPQVRFENATDLMQEARSVKSTEEIAFIEKAAEIIGNAITAMIEIARPGVPENHLIAELLREMTRQGGEPITMLLFGAGGPEVPWAQRVFTARPLKSGDLINTEVEGRYAGYIAQALQPIALGARPDDVAKMYDATKIIFDKMLKLLKPGVFFGEIVAFYQEAVRAAGYEPGEALMHGRGLGEDAPMVWGGVSVFPEARQKLKEGHVFILKPAARKGAMRDSIRAGDTVAIEAGGARRLGKRPLEFLAV